MTKAQLRALIWLQKHGIPGQPDRYGRMIAADGDAAHFLPATFLRLIFSGHITMSRGLGGFIITNRGYARLMLEAETNGELRQQLGYHANNQHSPPIRVRAQEGEPDAPA